MSETTKSENQEELAKAPKHFLIDANLADAIYGYLSNKPHGEVKQMIAGLENLRPVNVQEAPEQQEK